MIQIASRDEAAIKARISDRNSDGGVFFFERSRGGWNPARNSIGVGDGASDSGGSHQRSQPFTKQNANRDERAPPA